MSVTWLPVLATSQGLPLDEKVARVVIDAQKVMVLGDGVQVTRQHHGRVRPQMSPHILRVLATVQSVHVPTQDQTIVQPRFGHIFRVIAGRVDG
jgi:imidazoleglycerol phosphate dehydratase HisB